MIDRGKRNVSGVLVDVVDYDAAVARVIDAARRGDAYGVTALAVHGLMEAVDDPELRYRVNDLELVTPDGMAVKWGLNLLHGAGLADRCYGPTLMLEVCRAAAVEGLPVFLYGSRPEVVETLASRLIARIPGLAVAGHAASQFRQVDPTEMDEIAARVRDSGARIAFIGLGCPRQEVFAYEFRHRASMPVLAVGAAFDYHAGMLREPPKRVQDLGFQWLWRLAQDPRRLWRRYASTNPRYLLRLAAQRTRLWQPDPASGRPPSRELGYA